MGILCKSELLLFFLTVVPWIIDSSVRFSEQIIFFAKKPRPERKVGWGALIISSCVANPRSQIKEDPFLVVGPMLPVRVS